MQLHRYRLAALATGMLTIATFAQNSAGSPPAVTGTASTNQNAQAAPGEAAGGLAGRTALLIELSKGVDARKAKVGDPVEAKLTQDVKADGKVVLHHGAKLFGHITEAKARSKDEPESRLGVVFEKATGKGGEEFAFRAVVIAVAPSAEESSNVAGDPTKLSSGPTMGGAPFGAGHAVGGPSASAAGSLDAATGGGGSGGGLTAASRGAIGMPGVALRPSAVNGVQGTVLISDDHNLKLEGGTRMVLLVSGPAAAHQ